MPPIQHLLWPALGFAVALIAVLALRWAVMTVFNRWATGPGALAAFLQAIRLPSLLWCGVMAFYVTIEVASEADVLPRRLPASSRPFFRRPSSCRSRSPWP